MRVQPLVPDDHKALPGLRGCWSGDRSPAFSKALHVSCRCSKAVRSCFARLLNCQWKSEKRNEGADVEGAILHFQSLGHCKPGIDLLAFRTDHGHCLRRNGADFGIRVGRQKTE